jgi:hypothetical protein
MIRITGEPADSETVEITVNAFKHMTLNEFRGGFVRGALLSAICSLILVLAFR